MAKIVYKFALNVCILFALSWTALSEGDCDYTHDKRTFLCQGIKKVFPSKYYGNYHLRCEACHLDVFSKETFPYDNTLATFNMSGSIISNITEKAFSKMTSAQYMYLDHIQLRNVSANAFNGLQQVYELHLDHNNIDGLTPLFLNGFEGNTVRLNNNALKEIPENVFEGVLGIMVLDLGYNHIRTLHVGSFRHLDGLEFLSLDNNQLCKLPIGVFQHTKLLKELNLSGNRFKLFHVGIFSGLRNLIHLNVSYNVIGSTWDPDMLLPLGRLSTLDISANDIKFVNGPELHSHVPSLRHLSVNDNPWMCGILGDLVQYLRSVGVDTMPLGNLGRYEVTNINGVACSDRRIEEDVPFEYFLKILQQFTKESDESLIC